MKHLIVQLYPFPYYPLLLRSRYLPQVTFNVYSYKTWGTNERNRRTAKPERPDNVDVMC